MSGDEWRSWIDTAPYPALDPEREARQRARRGRVLVALAVVLAVVGVWAWLHLPELLGWGCS